MRKLNNFIHINTLMKKLYTLASVALLAGSFSVSANTEMVNRGFTDQEIAESSISASATGVKSAKVSTREDDWTDIGEGSMREAWPCGLAKNLDPQEITGIKVQQSKTDKNCYRFVNPYQNYDIPFSESLMTYDATGTYYLYVNLIEKGGKTYWYMPEPFRTGIEMVYNPSGNPYGPGMVNLVTFNLEYIASDPEKYLEKYPQMFGDFKDGIFTFPAATDTFETKDGETKTFYHMMWNGVSSLEEGQAYIIKENNFALALPGKTLPAPPDPWDAYTLVGNAQMYNSILFNLFKEYNAKESTVVVYEEPLRKGQLHIKNAWVDGSWNNPDMAAVTDFAVDMSVPDNGVVDWQDTGYEDIEYKSMVETMSYSAFWTMYIAPDANGKPQKITLNEFKETFPESVITLGTDNVISIPAAAMVYMFPDTDDEELQGRIVFAPDGGKTTTIKLPASYVRPSAVNGIEIDNSNAPVRYFNLQGVEVANPAAGELVIKVQGSKASKLIMK